MYFNAIVASPLSQRYYSLHRLSPKPQIDFDSRLGIHDVDNDCLMSVDGTHFRIPQKGAAKKGNPFGSHKYAGKSALRYELGVDILMGIWCGSRAHTLPGHGPTSRSSPPVWRTSSSHTNASRPTTATAGKWTRSSAPRTTSTPSRT
jgi:hypothetical protein